jgi:hypothetical protein
MSCKSCASKNLRHFRAEIAIHWPGLKNLDQPVVWVFPELVVCLDCGIAQFSVSEAELRLLQESKAAGEG